MSRTTALALIALSFLAASVALLTNDCEITGFGCLLLSIVVAADISEV